MRLISSLSNRIFLASVLLAVLSIGAALLLVNVAVTRRAEAELERSLEEAGELVAQFQSLFFEQLVIQARLVADLPRLKAAVYERDAPTVLPIAEEFRRQIGADLFAITDRDGRPLAVVGDAMPRAAAVVPRELAGEQAVRTALTGGAGVDLWSSADGLLQVVSVPIAIDPAQPEILGSLTVGLSLSRRLADRIKALTRTEVVFVDRGRVQASTLSAPAPDLVAVAAQADRLSRLSIDGEEYEAVRRPLVRPTLDQAGSRVPALSTTGAEAASVVVLRSTTAHFAFLRTVHTALAVTAVLAVVLATILSYAVARTVTRPIRALTATMREMAATGNLSMPAASAPARWDDEDARLLTRTFQSLTESLGRFQREAAQRERLSSLGRLSTVIAHEVRNPLMIIKASLRRLRRAAADEVPPAEAIADIEGEVVRLNQLVNEVLDYARPIVFSKAPVDLARLVSDAVQAVVASEPGPPIAVDLPERLPASTDGERVRQALINVIANARDAVVSAEAGREPQDAGASSRGAAAITVSAVAGPPGHATIEVRDCGVGMSAEQAGRMFEPFFTTKRTGSGIGLAITRNIVDGLGGTIVVDSEPARGTSIRMVVPLS